MSTIPIILFKCRVGIVAGLAYAEGMRYRPGTTGTGRIDMSISPEIDLLR